jgi:hypothetical protein
VDKQRFKFSIRDLLWLAIVIGLSVALWMQWNTRRIFESDNIRLSGVLSKLQQEADADRQTVRRLLDEHTGLIQSLHKARAENERLKAKMEGGDENSRANESAGENSN